MIRLIDIRLNAAHPELPLAEAVTYTGAPSTALISGVPGSCGKWGITSVSVAATYPDGSTTTRAAVQSANGVWVATLPATQTSGRTACGLRIIADGVDENGDAVTGYILGIADFAVRVLGVAPAPAPGQTSYAMSYFDAAPSPAKKGDVAKIDGALKFYDGADWISMGGGGELPAPVAPAEATEAGEYADALATKTELAGKLGNSGAQLLDGSLAVRDFVGAGEVFVGSRTTGLVFTQDSLFVYATVKIYGSTVTTYKFPKDAIFATDQACVARLGDLAPLAPLASPAFTGTPTAPTPASGDDSAKVATTAFVQAAVAGVPLRYDMPTAVALVAESDEATLICADRAVTNATIAAGFSTLNLTFPDAVSGKVRDFYLRIVVAAGESAPALSIPQGITIENPDGAVPEIADGEASAASTTIVWFSETAPNIFTAKSETVKAVA